MHTTVEEHGVPVEVVVTPGQTGHFGLAEMLTENRTRNAVTADRDYDADRVVDPIERQGSEAVISPRNGV